MTKSVNSPDSRTTIILFEISVIVLASFLSAAGLHIFVFTADFSPIGVDGIATMLQKITGINMGYFSLLINVPLLLIAWYKLDKKYVFYTLLISILASGFVILMEHFHVYQYVSQGDKWIAAVFSGVLHGIRTGLMIKIGGSAGGMDVLGCLVQKKRPYINVETPTSAFCYVIIALSFFVYRDIDSIFISILHIFVFSYTMGRVLKPTRNAIEAKIVTDCPEKFKNDITMELKHGATIVPCNGMYSGDSKSMVITVINIRQMNELLKLAKKYENTFVYFSEVNGVWGNFRWNKSDKAL